MNKFGLATTIEEPSILQAAIKRCREREIILPTFPELENPQRIDAETTARLAAVDPDAADPPNLCRIHWFNARERRHRVEVPQHVVLPETLTGVAAPIVVLLGDSFPMIRAHKVPAA